MKALDPPKTSKNGPKTPNVGQSSLRCEQSVRNAAQEMAQKNRASVDLSGLRGRIEKAYPDAFWQELSLAKKLRILLQDRINDLEESRDASNDYETEGGQEAIEFIFALANGRYPSKSNMVVLAAAMNLPAEALMSLCDAVLESKRLRDSNATCQVNN